MAEEIINYSIISNDKSRAYTIANKFKLLGINLEYITTTSDMLKQMIKNEQCIIIVDLNSKKLVSLIEEFNSSCNLSRFNFIFLTDRITFNIKTDNAVTFECTTDELFKMLPKVIFNIATNKFARTRISRAKVEEKINSLLVSFGIKRSLCGFNFISDAVKMYSGNGRKSYASINDIYNSIARKYDKNSSSIEKSIRFAINKAAENPTELFKEYFLDTKSSNYKFVIQMTTILKDFFNDLTRK
ncbi:MAG: hypothetical protein IJW59_05735 [Clostridia bacterium]|nr:hypothetical protein [Clostridia bacterium]